MGNKQTHIDQYYREALSGYSETISSGAWGRMKWRLLWLDLKSYIIGFAAIAIIGTVTYFSFFNTTNQPAETFTESPVIVEVKETSSKPDQVEMIKASELAVKGTTPTQILADNYIPPSETKVHTEESIIPIGEIEEVVLVEKETKEPDSYQLDALPFVTNEHPESLNLAKSTQELLSESPVIDSITYPYHNIRKKSWISIGLYVAPAYTTSVLSTDQSMNDYLNYRNDHESGTISWSAGADVQFNIKNWYIQTGLAYSVFSENRNYNHTFQALDSLNSYFTNDTTWGWVYDPPVIGKPVVLGIDSVYVPVYNDINEGTNEWRYLEVPLLVGYTFNVNRFGFDLGTGLSYGLLLGASGNVPSITDENRFTELSGLEDEMNKHIFNYVLQIGVSYHLTPAWSLICKPYYKQNLQSVFDNNYPVDQRFKAFGVKFGLKVDL